jgi:hypothetical protein
MTAVGKWENFRSCSADEEEDRGLRHDEDHDGGGSPRGETPKTTSARTAGKSSRKVHLALLSTGSSPFLFHSLSKTCVRHREALGSRPLFPSSFRPCWSTTERGLLSYLSVAHCPSTSLPFFTVSSTCTLSPQWRRRRRQHREQCRRRPSLRLRHQVSWYSSIPQGGPADLSDKRRRSSSTSRVSLDVRAISSMRLSVRVLWASPLPSRRQALSLACS